MNWKEPEAKVYTFEDMLEEYGYIVYTNVGVSMMPLLRQRQDVIEIRKKGPERCKKYDVVLYKIGSKYILHRIIQVREKDYVIVGDHNIWREWGITDSQILGVMTRVIRNGKTITPENRLYQLYVHLWVDFYPIRAAILYAKRLVRGAGSKVKRGIKRMIAKERKE